MAIFIVWLLVFATVTFLCYKLLANNLRFLFKREPVTTTALSLTSLLLLASFSAYLTVSIPYFK